MYIKSISYLLLFTIVFGFSINSASAKAKKPVKIGIIGLTHSHVNGVLRRPDIGDIEIVGIVETNLELADRIFKRYNIPKSKLYPSIEALVKANKPDAVTAFNSIFEHLEVVQKCAPLGIHVMVEKPLSFSMEHANEMHALAKKHNIHLLTNYETTWYATNHKIYDMVNNDKSLGSLRKLVVHDGHQGPKEIGVYEEFLSWLTDPKYNGGGAIIDFGCYGANLITWLMNGERPIAVTAVTQQMKPDIYPKVDDEATIILTYPKTQGVIQASWNWTFSRKDMEVYGTDGYAIAFNKSELRYRLQKKEPEASMKLENREGAYGDPFAYFAGVINKEIKPLPYDLSSLENNMIVVEILDAAIKSAKSGKKVDLKK